MKLVDKLTKSDWRTMAIIIVIMGIVAYGALSSCTPHNYPDLNKHSLRFYPGNDSTYQFGDHRRDSLSYGDKMVPNGYVFADGTSYSFTIDSNFVEVTVNRTPRAVLYLSKGTDSKADSLSTDGTFSTHLHEYGHFIVEYNWKDYE